MLMGGLVKMHDGLVDGILDDPGGGRRDGPRQWARVPVYQLLGPEVLTVPAGAGQAHAAGQLGGATVS